MMKIIGSLIFSLLFTVAFAQDNKKDFTKYVNPFIGSAAIQLSGKYYGGNQFVIETKNNSNESIYINSLNLNGNIYSGQTLKHKDIIQGGKLVINLSSAH